MSPYEASLNLFGGMGVTIEAGEVREAVRLGRSVQGYRRLILVKFTNKDSF